MKADLHVHSTCSDGTFTPFEILDLAKKAGLTGLSITDHDTFSAYTPEFFEKAEQLNLEILVGTEISSRMDNENVHILAYDFDIEDQGFNQFFSLMQKKRQDRNREILIKLKKSGIDIDPVFLEESPVIGRPHIAKKLIDMGIVSTISQAFDQYLKGGGCAYSPGMRPTPIEVIEQVHKAKGKAIIGHPHLGKQKILNKLYDLPFDGIECYYARFTRDKEEPFLTIAKKKNWLITGGSDFHGTIKPKSILGSSWVEEEDFRKLKS